MTKRIPPDELDRIKGNIDLVEEVRRRGIELTLKGKELVGLCPFHQEENPSFRVNEEKQVWHCFGCDKGGDVIKFVMEYEKEGFRETLARFNGNLNKPSAEKTTTSQPEGSQNTRNPLDASSQNYLLEVIKYYHQTLKNTPNALAYLKSRGLNHPEMLDYFQIGFSNRSLHKILPPNPKKRVEPIRQSLKEIGIFRENGQEHFVGCLTFPVFKTDGTIGEIYGRRTSSARNDVLAHLYLPGSHQGIFNLQAIGHGSPLLLCESIIDALSFWVHGFRHVTASFGANGFTKEMLNTFKSKGVKTIQIAYDNDEGGNQAADKLALQLQKEGFAAERILLPRGKDVNEWMREAENPQAALKALLDNPQSYYSTSPASTKPQSEANWDGQQMTMILGDRHYRLRRLEAIFSLSQLKVQIKVERETAFFLDTLDLTSHRQRLGFISAAAEELGEREEVIKKDLGKILLQVELLVEQLLSSKEEETQKKPLMSPAEQEEALKFLKQENLLEQILLDFEVIGLVGEETNKLIGYLTAISRKLEDPLAVLIQSASAAGKTSLMDAILSLTAPEEQEKWTTMTGQALYYVEETHLVHKLLAVVEEEGVEKATYPLKILQSEKELKIATTVKDPKSGEFKVQNKCAKGPCAIFLTTTLAEVDEELINRFIRLTVNEDKEQTEAIMEKQREADTLEGLENQVKMEQVRRKHYNAQRLLQPVKVLNPFSKQLTFMSDYLRNRRDHKKYLTLIKSIALLHQYQRPVKQANIQGESMDYIEVERSDIEVANRLVSEVLGRCLDELAPQTRRLLKLILTMVEETAQKREVDKEDVRFTRRDVRQYTRWSDNQLKVHLKRLEELEYLLAHQGGRGQVFIYELLWQGEDESVSFLPGLIDPKKLK